MTRTIASDKLARALSNGGGKRNTASLHLDVLIVDSQTVEEEPLRLALKFAANFCDEHQTCSNSHLNRLIIAGKAVLTGRLALRNAEYQRNRQWNMWQAGQGKMGTATSLHQAVSGEAIKHQPSDSSFRRWESEELTINFAAQMVASIAHPLSEAKEAATMLRQVT